MQRLHKGTTIVGMLVSGVLVFNRYGHSCEGCIKERHDCRTVGMLESLWPNATDEKERIKITKRKNKLKTRNSTPINNCSAIDK